MPTSTDGRLTSMVRTRLKPTQCLANAGFIDTRVKTIETAQVAEQSGKMIEFMRTTLLKDCVARLPTEALRESFQKKTEDAMSKAFQEPFAYIRVTARMPDLH